MQDMGPLPLLIATICKPLLFIRPLIVSLNFRNMSGLSVTSVKESFHAIWCLLALPSRPQTFSASPALTHSSRRVKWLLPSRYALNKYFDKFYRASPDLTPSWTRSFRCRAAAFAFNVLSAGQSAESRVHSSTHKWMFRPKFWSWFTWLVWKPA